jgi:AraC-like DNA-binding protein
MSKLDITIYLQLPSTYVGEVASLLISKQIPFGITFSPDTEDATAKVLTEREPQFMSNERDITTINPENIPAQNEEVENQVFQEIYHKYLVKGIDTIPPNEKKIAENYGIPLMRFKKVFRAMYGSTFYNLYVNKKMERATQLLKSGHSASDVSGMIGYKHPIKFNKMFQKYIGMTPKQYQMKHYGSRNKRI